MRFYTCSLPRNSHLKHPNKHKKYKIKLKAISTYIPFISVEVEWIFEVVWICVKVSHPNNNPPIFGYSVTCNPKTK